MSHAYMMTVRPAPLWLFSEFSAVYKYSDLLTYLLTYLLYIELDTLLVLNLAVWPSVFIVPAPVWGWWGSLWTVSCAQGRVSGWWWTQLSHLLSVMFRSCRARVWTVEPRWVPSSCNCILLVRSNESFNVRFVILLWLVWSWMFTICYCYCLCHCLID